jgi:alkylation response protein AidB-like acyl-CoA dehydrogenase
LVIRHQIETAETPTLRTHTPIQLATDLAASFAARADEADHNGKLPDEDVRLLRESGYLSLNIPTAFGGPGMNMRDCLAAHLELSQGSASTAIVAGMHLQVLGNALENDIWPADVYERFARATVEEGALFNYAASEPKLGSPSHGGVFATNLIPHPDTDGWLLNGQKTWTTGGRHLTHILVRAQVGDDVGEVLVLQGATGLRWEETWQDAFSLRASDSHDVFFEDVHLSTENLIVRGGKKVPNAWFPMVLASVYLGTAIAARNAVIKFALERVPTGLGKPIATLPKIQREIGELDLALQAAKALLFEVAALWSENVDHRSDLMPRIASAKLFATETATTVTDQALRIAGGQALTSALPLERFLRDTRAGLMQPPSGDTAYEMIGRSAIGTIPDSMS